MEDRPINEKSVGKMRSQRRFIESHESGSLKVDFLIIAHIIERRCLVLTLSRLGQDEEEKLDSYLVQFAFTEITELHQVAHTFSH